jgi:peptidoglycan/LPS O-acetylase OafA/YrhL
MKRVPQLDGIRGLAISLVLVWHYYVFLPTPEISPVNAFFKKIFILSWSGVDLFFVLSGFLIGGILLDNRSAKNYYYTFYLRRICRILPLYFILIIPFMVVYLSKVWKNIPVLGWLFNNPLPLWSYATFTQNLFVMNDGSFGANGLGVTWSLAIEEQFYLILPFLIRFVSKTNLPYVFISLIIAAPLFRSILLFTFPTRVFAGFVLLPGRMDALFLGVLGAWILRQDDMRDFLTRNRRFAFIAMLLFGSIIPVLTYMYSKPGAPAAKMLLTIGFTCMSAFFLCLILISVISSNGTISKILSFKPLRSLGIVSYFVYLFHLIFLGLAHAFVLNQKPQNTDLTNILVTFLSLVLLFSIAALSWVLFEKPFIKFGHRVNYENN